MLSQYIRIKLYMLNLRAHQLPLIISLSQIFAILYDIIMIFIQNWAISLCGHYTFKPISLPLDLILVLYWLVPVSGIINYVGWSPDNRDAIFTYFLQIPYRWHVLRYLVQIGQLQVDVIRSLFLTICWLWLFICPILLLNFCWMICISFNIFIPIAHYRIASQFHSGRIKPVPIHRNLEWVIHWRQTRLLLAFITPCPSYNSLSLILRHKILITRLILRRHLIRLHIRWSADQPCLQIISGLAASEITKYVIKIATDNWLNRLFIYSLPLIISWWLCYMAERICWMIVTWPL